VGVHECVANTPRLSVQPQCRNSSQTEEPVKIVWLLHTPLRVLIHLIIQRKGAFEKSLKAEGSVEHGVSICKGARERETNSPDHCTDVHIGDELGYSLESKNISRTA
jgi:hypothetical protein